MTARRRFIAGNWKMNLDRAGALGLISSLRSKLPHDPGFDVAVFPPFPYVEIVVNACAGTPIRVGAQNCYFEAKGAFTGEVSVSMIADLGATSVILGHSERRHVFNETDTAIAKKMTAALGARLAPILCVGETLAERQAGRTSEIVLRQLVEGLAGVAAAQFGSVTIAYEPVWAIGTGVNATPDQAGEVHSLLRNELAARHGRAVADAMRILYGGSVTPENAAALLRVPGVDGALVGGASLDAGKFQAILSAANPAAHA
ncbi:MAG: triose-phosphate isomerase [Planctomycetes bacterium]|nr:triose-phosphate isomerase [Planctomycetota bacterium]